MLYLLWCCTFGLLGVAGGTKTIIERERERCCVAVAGGFPAVSLSLSVVFDSMIVSPGSSRRRLLYDNGKGVVDALNEIISVGKDRSR
ncbi:hypothetical protein M8C21_004888, partial [Ambrosia artemisiifolia]